MGYYKKVEISGVNTAQLPVLSALQAKELFRRYHDGDESARELLIEGNLRLVLSVIKRFENRNEDMDDLFQVGVVGLLKAIENFNPDLDVMPSSYLCPMISGEVRRYLRDNNTIRVSRSLRDTAYRALQVRERLTAEKSKEPSVDEIAKEIGLPKESVVQALDAIQDPVSLFEPVYHDGGDTLFVMDQVSDDKNGDKLWLENLSLQEAMHHLSEREKKIVALRFFEGKTQTEVSSEIGISQAQVSRLEKSALKRMRKYV
nr:RNA polymerase sporulation sigma factor SigG [uncultured Anaerotignum sp.]